MLAKRIFLSLILMTLMLSSPVISFAQCAMCKAVTESNMKEEENKVGAGLNKGILYLMGIPYVLGVVACIAWYRNRKHLNGTSGAE